MAARDRVIANYEKIKELIREIEYSAELILDQEYFNWGDVGDLANIREHLNHALGREDKDPE